MKMLRYHALMLVLLILLPAGCSNTVISTSPSHIASLTANRTETASISVAPTVTVQALPSSSTAASYPMPVGDFMKKYGCTSLEAGWSPTGILNYTEEGLTDKLAGCTKGYIVSIGRNDIVIDKVNWIQTDTDSGFDTVDTHETTKYPITSETQFWLLIDSYGNYQVSQEDLISYNKAFGQETLWNVVAHNGKLELLVEQYLP